mgnify:CR=1 FL=1
MSNRGGAEDFEEYYGPDEAPMTAVVMFTPGSGASSVMGSRPSSAASSVVHATTRLVRGGVGGVGGDMNAAGSSLTSEPSLGEVSGRSSAQSHLGFVNEYYRGTAAWSAGIAGESVTLDPRNPTTTTQTTASSGGHHGVVADARRVPWNSPLVVRIGREMDTPRNGIPLYTDYIAVAWVDFSSLPPLRAGGGDLATAAAIIGTRPPSPSSGPKQRGPAAQRATASPALPYRTSATPTILPPFSVGGGSGSLQFAAAEDDFSSESAALTSTSRAGGLAHFGPGNVLMQLFIVRRYCWASFKLSASHQMSRLCQKAADDASNNVQRVPPHHHTSPPSASSSSILACAQTAEATAVGAPLPAFTNDSFDADVSHHNAHAASTTSSTTTTTTTPPLNLHATVTPPLPPPSIHLPPSQGGTTTHSGTSGSNSRSTSSSGEKQPGTGAPTTPAVVGGPSSAAPFTRVGSDPKWSVQSTSSRSSAVPPRSATTVTPPSHVASNSTDHHASASLPPVPVEAASRSPTTEGVSTASNQSKATPPFFPRGGDGPIVVTLSEPSTVAARARKNRGRRSSGDKKNPTATAAAAVSSLPPTQQQEQEDPAAARPRDEVGLSNCRDDGLPVSSSSSSSSSSASSNGGHSSQDDDEEQGEADVGRPETARDTRLHGAQDDDGKDDGRGCQHGQPSGSSPTAISSVPEAPLATADRRAGEAGQPPAGAPGWAHSTVQMDDPHGDCKAGAPLLFGASASVSTTTSGHLTPPSASAVANMMNSMSASFSTTTEHQHTQHHKKAAVLEQSVQIFGLPSSASKSGLGGVGGAGQVMPPPPPPRVPSQPPPDGFEPPASHRIARSQLPSGGMSKPFGSSTTLHRGPAAPPQLLRAPNVNPAAGSSSSPASSFVVNVSGAALRHQNARGVSHHPPALPPPPAMGQQPQQHAPRPPPSSSSSSSSSAPGFVFFGSRKFDRQLFHLQTKFAFEYYALNEIDTTARVSWTYGEEFNDGGHNDGHPTIGATVADGPKGAAAYSPAASIRGAASSLTESAMQLTNAPPTVIAFGQHVARGYAVHDSSGGPPTSGPSDATPPRSSSSSFHATATAAAASTSAAAFVDLVMDPMNVGARVPIHVVAQMTHDKKPLLHNAHRAVDVLHFLLQAVRGVCFLHDVACVAHMDLHESNVVVVHPGKTLVCGFAFGRALSRAPEDGQRSTFDLQRFFEGLEVNDAWKGGAVSSLNAAQQDAVVAVRKLESLATCHWRVRLDLNPTTSAAARRGNDLMSTTSMQPAMGAADQGGVTTPTSSTSSLRGGRRSGPLQSGKTSTNPRVRIDVTMETGGDADSDASSSSTADATLTDLHCYGTMIRRLRRLAAVEASRPMAFVTPELLFRSLGRRPLSSRPRRRAAATSAPEDFSDWEDDRTTHDDILQDVFGTAVDVYAIGLLLWHLFLKRPGDVVPVSHEALIGVGDGTWAADPPPPLDEPADHAAGPMARNGRPAPAAAAVGNKTTPRNVAVRRARRLIHAVVAVLIHEQPVERPTARQAEILLGWLYQELSATLDPPLVDAQGGRTLVLPSSDMVASGSAAAVAASKRGSLRSGGAVAASASTPTLPTFVTDGVECDASSLPTAAAAAFEGPPSSKTAASASGAHWPQRVSQDSDVNLPAVVIERRGDLDDDFAHDGERAATGGDDDGDDVAVVRYTEPRADDDDLDSVAGDVPSVAEVLVMQSKALGSWEAVPGGAAAMMIPAAEIAQQMDQDEMMSAYERGAASQTVFSQLPERGGGGGVEHPLLPPRRDEGDDEDGGGTTGGASATLNGNATTSSNGTGAVSRRRGRRGRELSTTRGRGTTTTVMSFSCSKFLRHPWVGFRRFPTVRFVCCLVICVVAVCALGSAIVAIRVQ